MAQINEKLKKLLNQVGEVVEIGNKDSAVWSLPQNKNVLIVKHKALEKVSAHLGMWFDPPTIIESNTEKSIVSLCVQGYIDDGKGKNTAWSIGEVSPQNTSNKYPYAMAEKRAIDRVILKLLGIHGDFYSEEEADEFKEKAVTTPKPKDLSTDKMNKEEIQKLAEEEPMVKEVVKHFPDAKLSKYFDESKFFKDLDGKEQRIDTEDNLIETMKGYVELLGNDYSLALDLYNANEDLFKLYKEKNSDGYADLMKWIGENTKKKENENGK